MAAPLVSGVSFGQGKKSVNPAPKTPVLPGLPLLLLTMPPIKSIAGISEAVIF
jgi:hypothetical protein